MNIEGEWDLPFPFDRTPSELFKLFENIFCISDSAVILKSFKDEEGNTLFEYDACIFIYDLNGELIDMFKFGGDKKDRFNSIILNDESIIAIGYTNSKKIDLKNLKYQENQSEGMIIEFDYEGNIINKHFRN